MKYEVVIGLEVHTELRTKQKFSAAVKLFWRRSQYKCMSCMSWASRCASCLKQKSVGIWCKSGISFEL